MGALFYLEPDWRGLFVAADYGSFIAFGITPTLALSVGYRF